MYIYIYIYSFISANRGGSGVWICLDANARNTKDTNNTGGNAQGSRQKDPQSIAQLPTPQSNGRHSKGN